MDQKKQDLDRPNQAANKQPAEGSRENAGGITNRPLKREQEEQSEVPPRGRTKDEEVGRNATGSNRDPVMPADDATLKTKI
jgi:hypothetical protein